MQIDLKKAKSLVHQYFKNNYGDLEITPNILYLESPGLRNLLITQKCLPEMSQNEFDYWLSEAYNKSLFNRMQM